MVWHAHVSLFGWEVHVPVGDDDDVDPTQLPADLCPSWSDLPTDDTTPLVSMPAVDHAMAVSATLYDTLSVADRTVGYPSSPLPRAASLQRIVLSSLTL
jgi:hypothetical protein